RGRPHPCLRCVRRRSARTDNRRATSAARQRDSANREQAREQGLRGEGSARDRPSRAGEARRLQARARGAYLNLTQAEDYLLSLELFGMRFGLDRMHKLMTALGMPQRRFASVHVVGTNGKSSTTRFTAAILEREGLATGIYTSPHLRGFPERIEIGERPLGGAEFAEAVARAAHAAELVNRTLDEDDEVTQFEALTAAAYHALARAGVEVAVIEAGLGGRYDATN